MKTFITDSPEAAAEYIKRGGIVAFPTETVYGLGASVFDELAVAKIFDAKQRPADNPLIAHIGHIEQIAELSGDVNEYARKFIEAFFPGPLTVVLKKKESVPYAATAGLDTIGIRMPRFPLAQNFLRECGVPIVAPSANLSGRPSPTTWEAVLEDLDGRIDCILQGAECEIGLESTVVDCTSEVPMVLRSGSISIERLREAVPQTSVYMATNVEAPKSPGLRHRHYSPRASVVIVTDVGVLGYEPNAGFIGLTRPADSFDRQLICDGIDEMAHSLFEFFRECDRDGIEQIICESVDESGIGTALMDRIKRAAEA
ncbi:MAG: L-threonylcarbamoyladenylate synthase [Pyrinomonadaceae bacterium]